MHLLKWIFFRDCYPRRQGFDTRYTICQTAAKEAIIGGQGINSDNIYVFFECLQLLNWEPLKRQDGSIIPLDEINGGYSVARDFFYAASEICFLGFWRFCVC